MRRFKKYGLGAGGMLVLVMAILLATGWDSAVAAQLTNVFVTNDASHPVPVSVNNTSVPVHEQGTASVNVTNTSVPVHEQGVASVQEAGTPTTVHFTNLDTYTVPAGKRLLIEYVSGYSDTSGYMVLEVLGGGNSGNFVLPTQDASNEFVDRWVMSYQVTIFAGPGAQLEAVGGTDAQITATG